MVNLLRSSRCIGLLALAILASAIKIPQKLGDGVYEFRVKTNSGGKSIDVGQFDISPHVNITAKKPDWGRRVRIKTSCEPEEYHNKSMDATDLEQAQAMLSNWCEMYDPLKGSMVIAIVGNATWYMCNYDWVQLPPELRIWGLGKQHCSRREIVNASAVIDDQCGGRNTGYLSIPKWKKYYGRGFKLNEVCPDMGKGLGP